MSIVRNLYFSSSSLADKLKEYDEAIYHVLVYHVLVYQATEESVFQATEALVGSSRRIFADAVTTVLQDS